MALSDILFCYIQYGRDSIPVSCIYIFTRDFGNWSGYVLRNWSILQKTEKTISLTIFLLLFILGVSIGSNSLIVNNLGKFGWQAIVLAVSGVLGSLIAARLVLQLFFRKGGEQ